MQQEFKIRNSQVVRKKRRDPVPKDITDSEFLQFIEGIKQVFPHRLVPYWENIFYCASDAGLRMGEMQRLRAANLCFLENGRPFLRIGEQKNGVANEKIIITHFLAQRLMDHAEQYKGYMQANGDHFFFAFHKSKNNQRNYVAAGTVQSTIYKVARATGLDDAYSTKIDLRTGKEYPLYRITYHTFRHYYADRINRKSDIQDVQTALRHKHISSTTRYIPQNTSRKERIIERALEEPKKEIEQEDFHLLIDTLKALNLRMEKMERRLDNPYHFNLKSPRK